MNARKKIPRVRLGKESPSMQLHIVVTEAWLTRVSAFADAMGITRSEAIRRLVDDALMVTSLRTLKVVA